MLVGADWACAHGEVGGIVDVARRLAKRSTGETQAEALAVAELCRTDPELALRLWRALRDRLLRE